MPDANARRPVGNLLGLAVLSYLSQRPLHPYELGRLLQERGDARSIKFNQGTLYAVVGQLVRAGLIAAVETKREGARPERTVYAITAAGREEMRAWLRELVAEPVHEHPRFVAALSLIAALPPDEVVALLRRRAGLLAAQRDETRKLMDETLAAGVHPLFQVEEEYRLDQLDTEIAFVERFVERIADPVLGWGEMWAQAHREGGDADGELPA